MPERSRDELEQAVWSALHDVADPCSLVTGSPIDVVDLGVVRSVRVTEGEVVLITITATSPGCLSLPMIAEMVHEAAVSASEGREVRIEIDRDFSWTPAVMSDGVRERKEAREREMVSSLDIRPHRERVARGTASTPVPARR